MNSHSLIFHFTLFMEEKKKRIREDTGVISVSKLKFPAREKMGSRRVSTEPDKCSEQLVEIHEAI